MNQESVQMFSYIIKEAIKIKDPKKLTRKEIEIVYLCGLLIPNMRDELAKYKEVIIKLCWNLIKSENKIFKNIGYLSTCKFISVYRMPSD